MAPKEELPLNPSAEQILNHLEIFKVRALNLASKQVTNVNAIYMEPRDLKILTDIVLNIEDSLKGKQTEGAQARNIKRLMDKYTTDVTTSEEQNKPLVIEAEYA